jgi:hypothetical protein
MLKVLLFTFFASFCFADMPDLKTFWIEFYHQNYRQAEKELQNTDQENLFRRGFTYDDYIYLYAVKVLLYQEMGDKVNHDFTLEVLKGLLESRYCKDLIKEFPRLENGLLEIKTDDSKALN